ncbi:hypothetical protein AMATHDRAFT_41407 [Amanita thiersii Skay4041]|uniref:Uncharacterized protein n=1 Tax=Amanita thiersii Skay4041 TaxID=703135 RepID=A0A2A9NHU8_9AGAR|nr:hypothetical protein AMATHDRAFT_41407 [Amanita thiersii Skay4041]
MTGPSSEFTQSPPPQESHFSASSISIKRPRDSTHLIPSPGTFSKPGRYNPLLLRWPVIIGTPVILFGLGVSLEIALAISLKNQGYNVPEKNIFSFVSTQFLLSFFPSLLVLPNAILWREIDWEMRALQPYVAMLKKQGATAEESVLLDYVYLGPVLGLFRALTYKHRLIFWSALTATLTYLLQPLTGAIFQIRLAEVANNTTVPNAKTIGLAPDDGQLDSFMAAAGFAESAVFFNLPDPSYIKQSLRGGWSTAKFEAPKYAGYHATLTFNNTGILTSLDCRNQLRINVTGEGRNVTIQSTSVDGCVKNVTVDSTLSKQQQGIVDVPCPDDKAALTPDLRPVMFWFIHEKQDGTLQAKTVFCTPSIEANQVTVETNLGDTSYNITVTNPRSYTEENNVTTTGDFAGKAFNGLIFPDSPDPVVRVRAAAIQTGMSSAIFRLALQRANNSDSVYDLPNILVGATKDVYLKHLSMFALSTYFVDEDKQQPAIVTSAQPRLWIDPLPAHFLSAILLFAGSVGMVIQFLHYRRRRSLRLASPPGSVASVVSLTAHSGFGEMLYPYDSEVVMEKKLRGFRFRLDERTGAVVADEVESGGAGQDDDDAMETLLIAEGLPASIVAGTPSSSLFAMQAAVGRPPWKTPYES